MSFTTADRDNDNFINGICCCGGWWFNCCGYVRLMGTYGTGINNGHGISWGSFNINLAYADMKIKQN
ncbi:hypothetical protein LSH36_212g04024 [Paralvinella palmiformis]|uniref:Fibrinogen C-terminal domain-containing protein n=1 Tax=Paralvinella palmiformis TaxID=53620 RepID=A0AAD9N5S8_9ANNE|nr:hypothetical protein LSH36_212g04024 [Paralvinella palmiformis]